VEVRLVVAKIAHREGIQFATLRHTLGVISDSAAGALAPERAVLVVERIGWATPAQLDGRDELSPIGRRTVGTC
jgi:hypothetical protein